MIWGRRHTWLLLAAFLFACQTQPDGLPPQPDSGPPKAHLDDCLEDHVPKPGGGCMRVGVALCADGKGIEGPDDWECKRVGVDECTIDGGPGLAGPPDWGKCKAIGPSRETCREGWAKQGGNWWCEPILPRGKCPAGTMEVIGKSECQPVGACDAPPATSPTVLVDPAHYPTIAQALVVAKSGDVIEVAQGTYEENLVIDTQVELRARCGDLVTIKGLAEDKPTITITADGVSLSRLAITGPSTGILINKAKATLRDLLVSGTVGDGVRVQAAEVTLESCVVRDVKKTKGHGAGIRSISVDGVRPQVSVTDCVLLRHWHTNISVISSDVTVKGSAVNETLASPLPGDAPLSFPRTPEWTRAGIAVFGSPAGRATLTVTHSLVAANGMVGAVCFGSDCIIEQTVVRDTEFGPSVEDWGAGVITGEGATMTVKDSLLRANEHINIVMDTSTGSVERTVIGPGRPAAFNGNGEGLVAAHSAVVARSCLVAGNILAGIESIFSRVEVYGCVVRDSVPEPTAMMWGCGILAAVSTAPPKSSLPRAEVTVVGSTISNNALAGIWSTDGAITVAGSRIQGTQPAYAFDGQNPSKEPFAFGIQVNAFYTDKHAALNVRDTIVSGNQGEGISVQGALTEIDRVVVSNNNTPVPERSVQLSLGIHAEPWMSPLATKPPSLTIRNSLVERARYLGIAAFAVPAMVERTIVRDTQPDWLGVDFGFGDGLGAALYSGSRPPWPWRVDLKLKESILERNHHTSLLLWSNKAEVSGCRIQDTRAIPTAKAPSFGDGIAATSAELGPVELHLTGTQLLGNARAGLLLSGGGGSVRGSMFARNGLTIALQDGADPEFSDPDDNRYVDNLDNKLSFSSDLPLPPMPVLPPSPFGE